MEYSTLTFESDSLNRKTFVENFMQVIEGWNNTETESDSLVVSIDAPWGSGKSYLLNMWKNWLVSEENSGKNNAVAYYNAWDNDDSENAFLPLVYQILQRKVYGESESIYKNLEERSKTFLKSCAIAILKDGIKKVIGEDTASLITEGIDAATEEKVESYFEKYEKYLEEKDKFRAALANLVPERGKLIVFIDELDRCRPTFAVETLEVVKHFFNTSNIVFIFAVDLEQLSHSISTMYGSGMDSEGYLRRFFDFNINIPVGNTNNYIEVIMNNYRPIEKYNNELTKKAQNIYTSLRLSLRDINKITNNFTVFCKFYKRYIDEELVVNIEKTMNKLEVYLFFMTLKYKYPKVYNLIIRRTFVAFDNAPKNWEVLEQKYFVSHNIGTVLRTIQTGTAHAINTTLLTDYCISVNTENLSFAEHIERTIEMFNSVK